MKIMPRTGRLCAVLMTLCLLLPQSLWASDAAMVAQQGAVDENPHWFAMVGDLFVARPLGLVMTAGGTALWLVSLPFSLMAGNAADTADTLILGPGEQTFVRCLGCRQSGYTYADMDQREQRKQREAAAASD